MLTPFVYRLVKPILLATILICPSFAQSYADALKELFPGNLERAIIEAPRRHEAEYEQAKRDDQIYLLTHQIVHDPTAHQYIQNLVDRITNVTTRKNAKFTVRVIQDDQENACTMGGEFIYINTGFLKKAGGQDEIAGVLAHEIGHVIAAHPRNESIKNLWTNAGYIISKLVFNKNEKASAIIDSVHQTLKPLYSREAEKQADVLGAYYAIDAGFRTEGLVNAFKRFLVNEQEAMNQAEQVLRQASDRYQNALNVYNQYVNAYNQTRDSRYLLAAQNAHNQLLAEEQNYNLALQQYKSIASQLSPIFRSHPNIDERIRTIEIVTQYKRGVLSLQDVANQDYEIAKTLEMLENIKVYQQRGFISVEGEKALDAYNDGNKLFARGKYEKAAEKFKEASVVFPSFWEAHYNLACAYQKIGMLKEAESSLNEALRYNPKSYDINKCLGIVYFFEKDFKRAMTKFNELLKQDPTDPDCLMMRGSIYCERKDYNNAIKELSISIGFNPKRAEAYYARGFAYARKDDINHAILDFTQAIKLNPKYAMAYNNRGFLYNKRGNYDKAISDCNKAIGIDPRFAYAYSNRGLAYAKKGNFKQATLDCDKAINLDPNCGLAYFARANVNQLKQDYDNAWNDVHKAKSLGYETDKEDLEFIEKLKKVSGREK